MVGGGLAGLAAALEAADRGASVTLLEQRPRLGGATWSFQSKGIWFDNGQHVFLRCCSAYRAFLTRIGSADKVTIQDRLDIPVLRPEGPRGRIRRTAGPAPLNLAYPLLTYPHLRPKARLKVLATGLALRKLDPTDPRLDQVSFWGWLRKRGHGADAVARFWDLVILPTVNVPSREASLMLAAKVFVTGLLSDRDAGDIGWSSVPLSALHADAARLALQARGAEVELATPVSVVRSGPGDRPEVVTGARRLVAESVVVAVPHDVVGRLLPPNSVAFQDDLSDLGFSPIVNVHLVYDRRVTELPLLAAVDSDIEYVFDRTEAAGLTDGRQCLTLSLSAAHRYLSWSTPDLTAHFAAELSRLIPDASKAEINRTMVTREPKATFLGRVGTHRLRPKAETRLAGVYLAGAWCDTGWPATMEGAVRSGVRAGGLAARCG